MERAAYAFFWGCQIPARLPHLEKSARLVLGRLGVAARDLDGFTCCPERNLIGNLDERAWFLTAARNLAVAERAGLGILTTCNGCYATLKTVLGIVRGDPNRRSEANEALARVGLSLDGRFEVKHLIEVFYHEVGPERIAKVVVRPLRGMAVAVHPGCHLLRPSHALQFDDPLQPTKYDALVEALGAQSVKYDTKMQCCGGALGQVGELDEAVAMVQRKLLNARDRGAEAITTCCPECFLQFDQKQAILQRRGDKAHLPVFTYPELLGLALGFSEEELGLAAHKVSPESFLAAWEEKRRDLGTLGEAVDLADAERCYRCGACVSDCPVAQSQPGFDPNALIGLFVQGRSGELLADGSFWQCLECHTCLELCPQRFGMEQVFTALKHLAIQRRQLPGGVKIGVDMFVKTGRLGEPDLRTRRKLGLSDPPAAGAEELRQLLAGGVVEEEEA
ncbi:MAG: heterodisulfide reductase-related iron-sulfur binding cluster [Bacillota bacterium]|nr:heterodisulfide reductase-related iron-sulfur binding cluster [Bacillota bacterium]